MIKRFLSTCCLLICFCLSTWANQKVTVKLDTDNHRDYTENLAFANIKFEYIYTTGNNARVRVTVENITQNPPFAILIFKKQQEEKELKRNKPKIEFDKKLYPGNKGERIADGCHEGFKNQYIIIPAETDTLFTLDVPFTSGKNLVLPFYIAKYKPKDLTKKGKNNISYTILQREIFDFDIEVQGWTENDPTYVATKKAVDGFIASLNEVKFCNNKKHSPGIKAQQSKYQATKDDLINEISSILEDHRSWMSADAPHIAYSKLLKEVQAVNLDTYISDCGHHKAAVSKAHKCGYCSSSAQQLYHKLDNTYQQLYSGKITKEKAVKIAKEIQNCYQNNKNRKKDSSYENKISGFYNRIINY